MLTEFNLPSNISAEDKIKSFPDGVFIYFSGETDFFL